MVGIMRAGAAYVPLDHRLPRGRLEYLVEQCESSVVVVMRQHSAVVEPLGVAVVEAEGALWKEGASGSKKGKVVRGAGCDSRSLAYTLFTSGSTGKPKGVMIEHQSLVCFLCHEGEDGPYKAMEVEAKHTRLYVLAYTFDDSVGVVWKTLTSGARLVVGKPDAWLDPPYMVKLMQAMEVSSLWGVPSPFALVMEAAGGSLPGSLWDLHLSGEALPPRLVAKIFESGGVELFNPYGPAEVTINSHAHKVQAQDATASSVPIGTALPNTTGYVLDKYNMVVPVGVAGELWLGGPKVARGYMGREDLTRGSMMELATLPDAGRLYKTGDRVRWLRDGNLDFIGRVDFQVKLNGQRLETGEIEATVRLVEGVNDALVTVHKGSGTARLVVYVVPATVPIEKILSACREQLPAYMVPSVVMRLEEWPLNANGKIDRKQLPEPDLGVSVEQYVAPTTTTEILVQAAFASSLGVPVDKISLTEDFFTMGGTSLTAVRVMQELRQKTDRPDLSIALLLKARNIRGLAEELDTSCGIQHNEQIESFPVNRASNCFTILQSFLVLLLWLFDMGPYAVQMSLYVLVLTKSNVFSTAIYIQLVTWTWGAIAAMLFLICKWSLLGKVRPGMHPLWGNFYLKWWFCNNLYRRALIMCPLNIYVGPGASFCPFIQNPGPLLNMWLRACGASIGKDVVIDQVLFADHDLVAVGAGSSLNYATHLNTSFVRGTWLILGPVVVGENVTTGQRCNVMAWSSIGTGCELRSMTSIGMGQVVPSHTVWEGSPGRCVVEDKVSEHDHKATQGNWNWHNVCLPMLTAVILLCVDFLFMSLQSHLSSLVKEATDIAVMVLALPAINLSTGFVQLMSVSILCRAFTWVVVEGYHKVNSWGYTAFLVYQLALQNMNEHGSVYDGTVVYHNILQCIGAQIGKYTEFQGNAFQGMPNLMHMGEGSFVGGGSFTFTYQMKQNSLYLAPVTFDSAFLGNDSVTAPGATLGDSAFVGSLTPIHSNVVVPPGEVWQGNPPMKMGSRPVHNITDGTDSVVPDSRFVFYRRVLLETCGWFASILNNYMEDLLLAAMLHMLIGHSTGEVEIEKLLIILPTIRYLAVFLSFFLDFIAKWTMFGAMKADEYGLWSCWLQTYNMYQVIFAGNSSFYVPDILGSPIVVGWFRMMGASIGKNVFLYSTEFTEWDLVRIGDNVAFNVGVTMQPHTYEDRVFKMGDVVVEDGVTIHASSLLLPGTLMEEGAEILPLSLPFTGEQVAAGTWQGNPVTRIGHFSPPLSPPEGCAVILPPGEPVKESSSVGNATDGVNNEFETSSVVKPNSSSQTWLPEWAIGRKEENRGETEGLLLLPHATDAPVYGSMKRA